MNRPTPVLHLEQQRFGERAVIAGDALACAALTAARVHARPRGRRCDRRCRVD